MCMTTQYISTECDVCHDIYSTNASFGECYKLYIGCDTKSWQTQGCQCITVLYPRREILKYTYHEMVINCLCLDLLVGFLNVI